MSSKSYSINHATNTAVIKDHSFRNCIKLLALAALICFITTVLILCWLRHSSGIEPTITTTTENYGRHEKVIQGNFKVPGTNSNHNNNRRLASTTPRPNFDKSQYKYIPGGDEAHLHGPNIDDPVDEEIPVYEVSETDTLETSLTNLDIEWRKMDIRFDVVKEVTTEGDVENITTNIVTKFNETTTLMPELVQPTKSNAATAPTVLQRLLAIPEKFSTTENFDNTLTTTEAPAPKLEAVIQRLRFAAFENITTTDLNDISQSTTLLSLLSENINNLTATTISVPIPSCPTLLTNVVTTCPTPLPVCETLECRKSSSKILSLLNHESDACDDFYAYTCSGSHLHKVDLNTEDDDIYGTDFQNLTSGVQFMKKYKQFYDSCMSYDKHSELPLLRKHIKNIHIENATVTDKATKLADLLADILKFGVHGSSSKILPIIDIIMDIGPDGKFIPVITIAMDKSPIMTLGDGDFYEKHCLKFTELQSQELEAVGEIYDIYDNCMQNYTLYETVLQKSIDKLRIFDHLSDYDSKQKASKVITIIMWTIIEDIGAVTKLDKYKMADMYDAQYYSLDDLQRDHPEINWHRFFSAVFNNASFLFDKIKIMYPDHLKKILNFYKSTDYDEIQSSILAMIAHDLYIDYLDGSLLVKANDRKLFCSKLTISTMKEISTKILVNQYSDEQIALKEKMIEKIFFESKASFAESIGNSTWLSPGEKELFVNKIKNIKLIAKSTEMYESPAVVAQMYADIDIQDSLVHNTLAMMKFRRKFMYGLMSKDFLDNQYFWTYLVSPLEKSARTIIELDSVVVPFRLLSKSIPNAKEMKQNYEIYSKLSYDISYELASFFSPTNVRKFWTTRNEVYKNFAAINLIDPYITHTLNPYKLELDKDNIRYTLNSRFNDDAAIRIALDTYRWKSGNTDLPLPWLNLTIPQLFYVTFAQQFCHIETNRVKTSIDTVQSDKLQNYFRLNSIIMNSKNFPDEFDCHRGTNMNPSVKIEQFPHIFDAGSYDDITDNAT